MPQPHSTPRSTSPQAPELLVWAQFYFKLGFTPVPARGKKPMVKYGHWVSHPPTWSDIEKAFVDRPRADGIAVILPRGVIVIDPDSPEGMQWLEGKSLPDDAPLERTQHGIHVWLSMPKSIRMKAIVKPTPGVDLLGPGHLVFVEPSPGKEWATHLRSALPRAPDWLIEVAKTKPAPTARPAKGPTSPPPPDELALYRKLLPDLRWGGTAGRAWCPLHVDDKASLALYIRGGRISWRCHAECEGSAQGRGGSHHGGNVRDLGRLIRISYGQTQTYERAAATAMMLEMSEEARKLLMAIISRARDHFIDLTDPSGIGFDYRSIARRTGIDEVVGITPERPAGWLKNNGRSIRKAIWELERLGLKVIPGTSHVDGQRGRRTAFVIPGIWFASNATPTASATPDDPDHLAHRPQDFQKPATDTPPATRDDPQPGPEAWGGIDILLSADLGVTCVRVVRPRTHVTGPHTCDTPGHTHVTGPKGQAEGQELREVFETPTSYWRERSFDHRLPPDEEAELVRRGMVTQAEVDAMDGLGPIPEGDEPDRLPALEVDGDV